MSTSQVEIVEDDFGRGPKHSKDRNGTTVVRGDTIRVNEIDDRILNPLPQDEVDDLLSFVGETFPIAHINFDESVVVEKEWRYEDDQVMGHAVAVFPHQFEKV